MLNFEHDPSFEYKMDWHEPVYGKRKQFNPWSYSIANNTIYIWFGDEIVYSDPINLYVDLEDEYELEQETIGVIDRLGNSIMSLIINQYTLSRLADKEDNPNDYNRCC